MKILIYGLNYSPETTGTGTMTGQMAAWLAAQGHAVEAICGLPHYPAWKLDAAHADGKSRIEMLDGVRVMRARHFVPSAERLDAKSRIRLETSFSLWSTRYWLPKFFHRDKPDVVIAVMPAMQIAVWPMLYGWIRRVPWVLHAQDLQLDEALHLKMLKPGRRANILYRMEKLLLRNATRVSTITEKMRTHIIAKGKPAASTWIFPNWADISLIRPKPRDNAFRRSLQLGDDAIMVLYAGNMGEKQGLGIVLDAAHACLDDPRIHFVMAGDGGARPRLQRRTAELGLTNLRFVPVRPLKEFADVLAASDIDLVIQKREAADTMMPSKLATILAAGRASISTADPGCGLHDVVIGHDVGLAVPSDDAAALVSAIRRLAEDAPLREQIGQRARAFAETHLDKEHVLSEFEQCLAGVVERP